MCVCVHGCMYVKKTENQNFTISETVKQKVILTDTKIWKQSAIKLSGKLCGYYKSMNLYLITSK